MRCGIGRAAGGCQERKTSGVSEKEVATMKPKKPKGKC
jgi:hypothetical protein